ncbi:hypothetical protein A3649_06955 [Mycobacterium ulcerans]|nr:hypothetical protein A3649_06955 [Mycobacterium ulcerans]
MTAVECDASPWPVQLQDALHCVGYAVVEDVLDAGFLAITRDRMYLVQERILSEIGQEPWGSSRDKTARKVFSLGRRNRSGSGGGRRSRR